MPYVVCPRCRIRTYSAAPWSQSPECPSCGAELPVGRHGSVEARIRESLYPRHDRVARIGAPRPGRREPGSA
jgi:hypothetical protein